MPLRKIKGSVTANNPKEIYSTSKKKPYETTPRQAITRGHKI